MDDYRFDEFTRTLAGLRKPRRTALRLLAGALLGGRLALAGGTAEARCVPLGKPCGGGRRCCEGFVCRNETCRCRPGQTPCGRDCVDTESDPNNCGECGAVCPEGKLCVGGVCCRPSQVCGRRCCARNHVCVDGVCKDPPPACDPPSRLCDGTCVDVGSDPNHCGGCDSACEANDLCAGGTCCDPQLVCGNRCCELFQRCVDGECRDRPVNCAAPLKPCDGFCVDTGSDPNNCGGCGKVCAADKVCANGHCICPAGTAECGGACVDLRGDELNCGGCGKVCARGKECAGGACVCPQGTTECNRACVDPATFQSDVANCGGCGHVCPAPPHARPTCANGACDFVCDEGLTRCGGKCIDTGFNPNHCGGCGVVCPSCDQSERAICVGGECDCVPVKSGR